MSILKFKNPDGTWKSVTAIQGEPGKDGAIQYKPGKGINITEDNIIEAEFEDITVDETPVEGSNNPVSSGGVFEALENVNPNLQFTEMPDPNAFDVDKLIQYVGETNEQFTKGYWYKISETYAKESATILAGMSYVTDIIPSNHKVECVVDCTSYIYNGHVFGLYDPAHSQHTVNSMNFTLWQNGYWWGTDGTHINGIDNIFKKGIHKIVFNEKGEDGNYHITLNDEIVDTVKCTGDTQLALFMRGNEANFSGIFYHFKVWDLDTDELLLHLVPYELNGAGALYDLVSNEVKYTNKSMVCSGSNTNAVRQWVQVDTQPASVSWPEYDCPVCVVSCTLIDHISEPRYITANESAGQAILQKLNELYAKGVSLFVLRILTPDQQHIGYLDALMSFEGNTIGINPFELPKFFGNYKYLMPLIDNYMSISGGRVVANSSGYVIRIKNWMIDRYYEVAAKNDLASYAQTSAVLLKTNTTSYTPTANFHPATKKYVDDNFNNIPTIQYDTMPNIDTFDSNKIIQYVGETDEQFTKGHWYTIEGEGTGVSGEKEYATISSGTSVNTGITPTNHKVEYCFEYDQYVNNATALGIRNPNGSFNGIGSYYMHLTLYNNKYYLGANGSEYSTTFDYQDGKHTIIFNEGETYQTILDGVVISESNKAAGAYPLHLFRRHDTNPIFSGKFYYLKIWDLSTNELIMHLVPRVNESNGSELYDLISKQAIYTGSGVVADGPSVSSAGEKHWVPVEVQENKDTGGGNTYPIYYTYIPYDLVSPSKSVNYYPENSSKICEKFGDIFTDMSKNGYQIAEILNDAYSMNFKLTFRKPMRNNATTIYLLGTKYDFNTRLLYYSNIDVTYTVADGVYTVSQVRITPYSTSFATTSYVDDAVAGASGGITTETDPTVPAWAKEPNKPTYTASEVGALPASTVIPTKLSALTDDLGTNPAHSHSQYLTSHQDISGKQNKVLYGTSDPTSDIGVEGDIYVKYV